MNKIQLINSKGINESFINICSGSDSVEIEFELENMDIDTKDNTINICKYLNRAFNDNKIYVNEWVLVSHYPSAVLIKGQDNSGNIKYIKIMKGGNE